MAGKLRASVVIPTYNRRSSLLRTLDSFDRQTAPPSCFEVIVGVDGSTDGTVEALESLRPAYKLRWVVQQNRGPAAATNAAARLAEREVLIFLDDDQLAAPGFIAAHLDAHERLGDVLVQGFYPLAPGYDRRGASLLYQRWLFITFAPLDRSHPTTSHVWSANMSLRRGTWAAVGGLDETFREYGGEDTDFGVRVAREHGASVIFEPAALSYHMHEVSYDTVRRQAFSAGRSLVRLAQKHMVPLESFSGGELNRFIDRTVQAGWRANPMAMDVLGRTLMAPLVVADLIRIRPLQLTAARLLHRYYKIGGIATEQGQEVEVRAAAAS